MFWIKQELINKGHDVDAFRTRLWKRYKLKQMYELMKMYKQGGGNDIFIQSGQLSEMNLCDTSNVFDQEGGYAPIWMN